MGGEADTKSTNMRVMLLSYPVIAAVGEGNADAIARVSWYLISTLTKKAFGQHKADGYDLSVWNRSAGMP